VEYTAEYTAECKESKVSSQEAIQYILSKYMACCCER